MRFIAIALSLLLLAACGPGNTVKLLPAPPLSASTLPAPNAPSISIVNFKDERIDPMAIGARRDGTAFTTTADVSSWVSRALADELARRGFRVTFATNTTQARNSNPDFLVTGIVNEVWLKEISATEMTTQMRINCTLANRKGKLWTESCNSSQTRTGLPSSDATDNLLLDTLQDLIKPVVNKITQSIESKK